MLLDFQSHSAHSPIFRRKIFILGKALHSKSLGHNSKVLMFTLRYFAKMQEHYIPNIKLLNGIRLIEGYLYQYCLI